MSRATPRLVHREFTPAFIIFSLAAIGNLKVGHPPVLSGQAITFGTILRKRLIMWKHHRYGVIREFLLTKDRKGPSRQPTYRRRGAQVFRNYRRDWKRVPWPMASSCSSAGGSGRP